MRQTYLLPIVGLLLSTNALASSHREAPFITELPKVDGSDFYRFRSYEQGREGFVTLIANYLPLQDAYGGPNYFALDPDAVYEIHIARANAAATRRRERLPRKVVFELPSNFPQSGRYTKLVVG